MVKEFNFFVSKGEVKKQSPDNNLALATFRNGEERLSLAKNLQQMAKAKYVLENAYESMREAADSILFKEGFKSFSHEASIVYLLKKGFSESDLAEFDRFRKIRNGIKYYGGDCDKPDAEAAIKLSEKIISKVKEIIQRP
ncbi:TPA: HEPN domain-containing protein [Candidatus Woesearchaeota archaeon]|nr:HEPN domain-containing protein [Candidatus Woesearchaeota archaeon]